MKIASVAILCYKKLSTATRLHTTLKEQRQRKKISLEALTEHANIPLKYLRALEEGNFHLLPKGRPYRLGYLKTYAETVGLNAAECIARFEKEQGLADSGMVLGPMGQKNRLPLAPWSIIIRNLAIGLSAFILVGYLGWQVRQSFEPPALKLFSPADGQVTSEPLTLVQGETEKESVLSVNGQEVMVNDRGRFEIKLDLTEGLNTIMVRSARSKRGEKGRASSITRHVIVKSGIPEEAVSLR